MVAVRLHYEELLETVRELVPHLHQANSHKEILTQLEKYKEDRKRIRDEMERLWKSISLPFTGCLPANCTEDCERVFLKMISDGILKREEEYKKELETIKTQLKEKDEAILKLKSNCTKEASLNLKRLPLKIQEKVVTVQSARATLQNLGRENLETMEEEKLSTRCEEVSLLFRATSDKVSLASNREELKEGLADTEADLRRRNGELAAEKEELAKNVKSLSAKLGKIEADSSFFVILGMRE